jgi:hypothetical protein
VLRCLASPTAPQLLSKRTCMTVRVAPSLAAQPTVARPVVAAAFRAQTSVLTLRAAMCMCGLLPLHRDLFIYLRTLPPHTSTVGQVQKPIEKDSRKSDRFLRSVIRRPLFRCMKYFSYVDALIYLHPCVLVTPCAIEHLYHSRTRVLRPNRCFAPSVQSAISLSPGSSTPLHAPHVEY